ncbi:MAG TPA: stage II sporulation protein M [Polyangiales bacterium]|nr:stage II sporulation protein M [Polyangiales bacterium]
MQGFDVNRFVEERSAAWGRLEQLLLRIEREGLASLELPAVREFGRLYRAVSNDLLRARGEMVNVAVVDYINDIVARAYAVMHAPSRSTIGRKLYAFFATDFPRLFRRESRIVALAALIVFAGASVGASFVAIDRYALGALIPDDHQALTPAERVGRDEHAAGVNGDAAVAFSGWLFTHNLEVSFLVFALGVTFGLGTVALLFYNGVPLGALAMQYHQAGQGMFFWAWILPHGVAELTEVCIAGGAGLIIARGLWIPGRRGRGAAFAEEARTAASLVLGGAPLLMLAGVIEGTVSQMHAPLVPYSAKLVFAACVAIGVFAFLTRAGRATSTAAQPTAAK